MGENLLTFAVQSYWVLCAVAIGVSLWLPKSAMTKVAAGICTALIVSIPLVLAAKRRMETKQVVAQEQSQVNRAAERFAELCKSAGIKINRTVDDVEAVTLLKVRPRLEWKDYSDPMLPGAAMAAERFDDKYILSFLEGETPVSPSLEKDVPASVIEERMRFRGSIGSVRGPRYQFVDAVDPRDGQRYRHTLENKFRDTTSPNGMVTRTDFPDLKRELAIGPAPRYAVDYEDIVEPEDRKLWIAGTTVRVIDQQTQEVVAEYTTYVVDGGMGVTDGTRAPWQYASSHGSMTCPRVEGFISTHTRYFVDQVLKLKQRD